MIATVVNLSATKILNEIQSEDSGAALGQARVLAVGGARNRPLPFPFNHVSIAASGSLSLPVRPRDLRQREAGMGNGHGTHDAGEVWNQIIANKLCTFASVAQVAFTPTPATMQAKGDMEESFMALI